MAGQSILVIDDHPLNLKLVRVLLTGEGYEVHIATDGETALKMLSTVKPKLILMDIQLPGMDGLALTRRLKEDPTTSHIIILALTSYAMKGDDQAAFAAGCDGYITKPLDADKLPALIARFLSETG